MRKILPFIFILTIIISPCAAQQEVDEINHFENIFFSWQYYNLENIKNINFISLNPLFFATNNFAIDTFQFARRNYRPPITQTTRTHSNDFNAAGFLGMAALFYMGYATSSSMNQYQRDIYRNHNQEQAAAERYMPQ